jgi:hypothetical protein
LDFIKDTDASVEALSATKMVASGECSTTEGKNCSSSFSPFQLSMITAIFKVMY